MSKTFASFLLAALLTVITGCASVGGATYHFSIYVKPPADSKDVAPKDPAIRAKTQTIVDAWAIENGFQRVPADQADIMRMKYHDTQPEFEPLYYKETAVTGHDFREIVVLFDFGWFPVAVTGGEGYGGLWPSSRLNTLQQSLQTRLAQHFPPDLVVGSVW